MKKENPMYVVNRGIAAAPKLGGKFQAFQFVPTAKEWPLTVDHLKKIVEDINTENNLTTPPKKYATYIQRRAGFVFLYWRKPDGEYVPYAFTHRQIAGE